MYINNNFNQQIMNAVIENYKKIKKAIPQLIEKSGYRNDYIAKRLGMKAANFSVKKQRGNWNEDELELLIKTLTTTTGEVELFLREATEISIAEEHLKGEMLSSTEFEKLMKWK
jgi:predicted ATP-grasp superfamily ATP-dependent carboligase